jgi:hypothetical protein
MVKLKGLPSGSIDFVEIRDYLSAIQRLVCGLGRRVGHRKRLYRCHSEDS